VGCALYMGMNCHERATIKLGRAQSAPLCKYVRFIALVCEFYYAPGLVGSGPKVRVLR